MINHTSEQSKQAAIFLSATSEGDFKSLSICDI